MALDAHVVYDAERQLTTPLRRSPIAPPRSL